jgi:hypothetical protein
MAPCLSHTTLVEDHEGRRYRTQRQSQHRVPRGFVLIPRTPCSPPESDSESTRVPVVQGDVDLALEGQSERRPDQARADDQHVGRHEAGSRRSEGQHPWVRLDRAVRTRRLGDPGRPGSLLLIAAGPCAGPPRHAGRRA